MKLYKSIFEYILSALLNAAFIYKAHICYIKLMYSKVVISDS